MNTYKCTVLVEDADGEAGIKIFRFEAKSADLAERELRHRMREWPDSWLVWTQKVQA